MLGGAVRVGPAGGLGHPARPDTTLLLLARARRVGVSTFVQSTTALGEVALGGRQLVRYRLGSDWIYDSRGTPPFVREDYRADLAHIYQLGAARHWHVGQQLHYDQSRANATRTALWLARAGYQGRLRPGRASDTLSSLRVTALGGLATDTRNGRHDTGLAYGVDALAVLFAQGRGGRVPAPRRWRCACWGCGPRLGPRTAFRVVAEASGERAFLDEAALLVRARAGLRTQRAEDYRRGSVQRIQSDTLAVQAGGSYRISPTTTLRSDNSLLLPTRAYEYRRLSAPADTLQDSGYRQHELDTRQELRVTLPRLQGSLTFAYRERQRAYFLENSLRLSPARLAVAEAREAVKDITEQTTRWQGRADLAAHAPPLAGRPGHGPTAARGCPQPRQPANPRRGPAPAAPDLGRALGRGVSDHAGRGRRVPPDGLHPGRAECRKLRRPPAALGAGLRVGPRSAQPPRPVPPVGELPGARPRHRAGPQTAPAGCWSKPRA